MSIDLTQTASASLSERVAEEIRVLLTRQRKRQSELARALGVSEQWVSVRLRGVQPIDLNDLQRIAQVLEVDPISLIPNGSGRPVVNGGGRAGQPMVPTVEPTKRPTPTSGPKRTVPPASSRRPARIIPAIAELMPDLLVPEVLAAAGA